MYLSHVLVENFRLFGKRTKITFRPGLNLLVGENGCGKSAIIDAVRVLLNEPEFSHTGIMESDFYNSYSGRSEIADHIFITGVFSDLSEEQKVEFLSWLTPQFNARLNVEYERRPNARGAMKQKRWGGQSSNTFFDWDPLNDIQCVYLPPLRDAERYLRAGRGSRLARFITNLSATELKEKRKVQAKMPLEEEVEAFNRSLAEKDQIKQANKLINTSLQDAAGSVFGQSTTIQFNKLSYERIVESLKLLFSPGISGGVSFRELHENSLGYNNLIYIATILAEFEGLKEQFTSPRILLIEELEAHLHPQLQTKLLKYLAEQAKAHGIQIIISTHSTVLAAATPIENIISIAEGNKEVSIVPIDCCGISKQSTEFINRWLDATKSALLFSKGNILVEGIAEAILVPKLAEVYLKQYAKDHEGVVSSLEEAGISVINMNGIYFQHFMQLYNGYAPIIPEQEESETKKDYSERVEIFRKKEKYEEGEFVKCAALPIKCVALTDNDPAPVEKPVTTADGTQETKKYAQKPTKTHPVNGDNPQLYLQKQLMNMTHNCRIYTNLKTFEYDLAIDSAANAAKMIDIILEQITTNGPVKEIFENYKTLVDLKIAGSEVELDEAQMALDILEQIERDYLGKGLFAQLLFEKVDDNFTVPEYIQSAIRFILGIDG